MTTIIVALYILTGAACVGYWVKAGMSIPSAMAGGAIWPIGLAICVGEWLHGRTRRVGGGK